MHTGLIYFDGAVAGIVAGGPYALIAISTTLMYRSTGVLSFAHAAFGMLAAYIYTDMAADRGWSPTLAAGVAVLVTTLFGLVVERVALRRVAGSSAAVKMITTLGVLSFTSGLMLLLYGFRPNRAPLLLPEGNIRIGEVGVGYQQLAVLGIALASAVGIGAFLRWSRFGVAVRAAAQNPEVARLMGVSLNRVAGFNWALGAFLSAIAGVLVAPLLLLSVTSFPLLHVKALTASLVGGLASLPLTFLGGLLLGAVESVSSLAFTTPGTRDLSVLVVVLVVLLARRRWTDPVGGTSLAGALSVGRSSAGARVPAWLSRAGAPVRRVVAAGVVALGVAALAVPFQSEYWGFVGARAVFYVIEALSLVILAGWGGQLSLMHGAYVGIGAFATGWLAHVGAPLELALLGGGAAGMVLGLAAVLPALRLSGVQFAIASMAFASAASQWLFLQKPFAEPTSAQIARDQLFGISILDTSHLYGLMLVITALLFVVVHNLRRSTFGSLLLAARDNPDMVKHFGTSPERTRTAAFLLASFIASLGGGLFAVLVSSFKPDDFALGLSVSLLLYAVVGGLTSLRGPLIAGVAFGILPEVFKADASAGANAWPDLISGLVVVVLIAVRPSGLASLFDGVAGDLRSWIGGRSRFEAARAHAGTPAEAPADTRPTAEAIAEAIA